MSEPGVAQRFFGGLLMAIGGLIVLTSGLCSTVVLANLAIGALSGAFF